MLLNKNSVLLPMPVVFIVFFLLGIAYDFFTPLWNPPDEERHFAYSEYIAQNRKIPLYRPDSEANPVGMAFHPPLYYVLNSLLFYNDEGLLEEEIDFNDGPGFNRIISPQDENRPQYGKKVRTAHLLRIASLFLNGVTIYLIYRSALMLFPGMTLIASFAALFVATIPQFLYISASISNENLSTMLSAAYLFAFLFFLKAPQQIKYQVMIGVILGLCLLTKTTALFYLPVTICFLGWLSLKEKKNPLPAIGIIMGIASLIAGWWYLRNWLTLNDPTLSKTVATLNYWHIRSSKPSVDEMIQLFNKTFLTFFGGFGSMQLLLSKYHIAFYVLIVGAGVVGFSKHLFERRLNTFQQHALVLFLLTMLGGLGIYIYINLKYFGFFLGRYLFIIISPLAILISLGFYHVLPQAIRSWVVHVISFLVIIMNVIVIINILKPAYADPLLNAGNDQQNFCCVTPEINRTTCVGQTFTALHNNLCSIRVMFSNKNIARNGNENILFSLKECGSDKKTFYEIKYPLNQIEDCARYFFVFPPIANSLGKKYQFSFEVPEIVTDSGVSLWYETANCLANGQLLFNNKPVPGSLYFTTYHFKGDIPRTDWQGIKATVIRQGWYITIPELQLYYERSKDFRSKTATQEKIDRFERGLSLRKVQTQ